MTKQLLITGVYFLLSVLGIFLLLLFFPRTYNVSPLQKRAGTQFWDLPTGSKIGYTFSKGKGIRKPCPVIFLNGRPGGAVTDESIQLRSKLSDSGYDVYLYDQVGSGQSARLKNISDYTPERHRKDLEEIIKKIGAEKVILIGHSWGALLAVLYAAENQNRVEKIIFTCPDPIYPFRKELTSVKAPDSLNLNASVFSNMQENEKVSNIRTKAMAFFAIHFGLKIASDQEADDFETYMDHEVTKSTVPFASEIAGPSPGGGFYAALMTFNSLLTIQDPRPKLKHSTIPVFVMKAQYDNQQWGFTNEYCELFRNHKLAVIPDAGYAVSVEQPELYLKTIREFLAQ